MKGMKQQALPSRKEQVKQLDATVKQLQFALRINQMMLDQMGKNSARLQQDMDRVMGVMNDLQYRTLAMMELNSTAVPIAAIDAKADELKLRDYNDFSDKEDVAKGYLTVDTVAADSIVILTSEAADNKGIFRSKIKVDECGNPELAALLEGKRVGDKFDYKLNGVDHVIELLGVRQAPAPAVQPVQVEGTETVQ